MGNLEGLGPAIEPGGGREPVAQRVKSTEGIVEGKPPVGQVSKVREAVANLVGLSMGTVPAKDEENGGEGVEGEEQAKEEQENGREDP